MLVAAAAIGLVALALYAFDSGYRVGSDIAARDSRTGEARN